MALAGSGIGAAGARPVPGRAYARMALASSVDAERISLSGVLIDRVDLSEAARRIAGYLGSQHLHQIVTVNLDFLQIARADAGFRGTINEADLAVADGMPLVWASRLVGRPLPERVTGNALVEECCRQSAATGDPIFLLGGRPGIAEAAGRAITARHPGAVIAGSYAPPFGPLSATDDRAIVDRINRSGARILFVAFGAPRQDNWIAEHRHELDVRVAMGVGCSLDVLAGIVSRAPLWMQRSGLEWLHRFRLEPCRLWHRYFVKDAAMFARLLAESLRAAIA
jgi:N-acetylglucosaminyldiphosphoundecaprenol N-acetyl-beta-D-mannosaminyltransferase